MGVSPLASRHACSAGGPLTGTLNQRTGEIKTPYGNALLRPISEIWVGLEYGTSQCVRRVEFLGGGRSDSLAFCEEDNAGLGCAALPA